MPGSRAATLGRRIVLAGLFPTPEIKHGMTSDRFLQGVYRNRAKPLFDATALHPYSTTPRQAIDRVRDMRRTMARTGTARRSSGSPRSAGPPAVPARP